jgi:hypothetical protein
MKLQNPVLGSHKVKTNRIMTDYYVQRKEDTKMGLFCKRKQQK